MILGTLPSGSVLTYCDPCLFLLFTREVHMVLVVQIEDGRFRLNHNGKITRAPLTAEGLADLFRGVGYDPRDDESRLMCGSSIDFPEEDGAPAGFNGFDVVRKAVDLIAFERSVS